MNEIVGLGRRRDMLHAPFPVLRYAKLNSLQKLLDFLQELDERSIFYTLTSVRSDAIMVEIAVPGAHWEVEFFADCHVEVEVFGKSSGIEGEEALTRLFEEHSD